MMIILASSSPRRREIMKMLGIPFDVIVSTKEEKLDGRKSVYNQCLDIATVKAKSVFEEEKEDVIVIGSDTIVVKDKKIFGKPKDREEAKKMIKSLSNATHEVVTSVCMLIRKNGKVYEEKFYEVVYVTVNKMTKEEIDDWVDNHDVLTKAGAYAIQESFGKYISKIEGDYYSIVGLPLNKVYQLLKKYM